MIPFELLVRKTAEIKRLFEYVIRPNNRWLTVRPIESFNKMEISKRRGSCLYFILFSRLICLNALLPKMIDLVYLGLTKLFFFAHLLKFDIQFFIRDKQRKPAPIVIKLPYDTIYLGLFIFVSPV